jgi:hypothetical protein
MSFKELRARVLEEAAQEVRQDEELEVRIEQSLQKWRRGAIFLGIALVASIVAVIPFLYGHPLHDQWDVVGKKILAAVNVLVAGVYIHGRNHLRLLVIR